MTLHLTFMIRRSSHRLLAALTVLAVIGCNNSDETETWVTKPTQINGNKNFVALSLGDFHSCGLEASGDAFCWGLNSQGQSGNGVAGGAGVNTPTSVIGEAKFTSLSAGGNHTCGINTDGVTMCWGNNTGGQLGVASQQDKFEPTPVAGSHAFIQISAGTIAHTCAIKANGEAWCWGVNEQGQLGTGNHTAATSPVQVGGGIKFISIVSGGGHTCGISTDSSAYCWGLNSRGQLGDGTQNDKLIPTKVSSPIKFKQLVAGIAHTCGLNENGDPYCWGDNVVGAVGDGTFESRTSPTLVAGGPNFDILAAGERHTCGLSGTTVLCWGYNEYGALGDGTTITRTEPTLLFNQIAFKKIAAGAYFTCGIATSNLTYCWGDNYGFQLGIPDQQ